MLKGLCIIFSCLLIGDSLSTAFHLPVPGNVIGMVLLTLALNRRFIRLDDVKPVADALIKQLALLFVPPGVGLLLYLDVLRQEWLAIGAAFALSTLLVLAVVGHTQQWLERKDQKNG
jgi:holin-like protein